MTLDDIKNYLRLDSDYTDDDALIIALKQSAETYITSSTGKTFDDNELYNLLVKILVLHWYENRNAVQEGTYNEIPTSMTCLLNHLALCNKYGDSDG